MNFALKLFPDEHRTFIDILLLKSKQNEFDVLTLGNKILYIETLRMYQRKVQNRILSHWNKPRKEFAVTFKPYAADLITDFIYTGSAHYNPHTQNLALIMWTQYRMHCHNANNYLTNLQKQIDVEQ